MNNLFAKLLSDERVSLLAGLADSPGVRVYLVGGGLRDAVMGRVVRDLDFVLDGAVERLPREFAERIGGTFFWLDRERLQSRVVTARGEAAFTWDFAPVRGTGILEDLALRDFTVNSLALPLAANTAAVLDPMGGLADIASGTIKACGPGTFDDDPLRLVRAVRFGATLGFDIENTTWREMIRNAHLLEKVAGERVRDEFFLILAASGVFQSLEKLRTSGLLSLIIAGEGNPSAATPERIRRAARVEGVALDLPRYFPGHWQRFSDRLAHYAEGGVTFLSLVKLAAFLHGEDAGALIASTADRLRLGTKARFTLSALCTCAATFPTFPDGESKDRSFYRFFRDRVPAGPELLLLPLSENLVVPDLADRLVTYFFNDYRSTDPDLFLTGSQVMELLGIDPGPELGRHLALLRQAESVGKVASEAEAREFILKNRLTKEEPMG